MDVMAAQTAGLKNAYNGLVNTVNEESRENERDMRLVRYVTKLIEQCSDIDGKISSVIAHLGKVGELYGNHAACFEKIKSYLNSMDRGGKSDGGSNRRDFILGGLTKTEELLREVRDSCPSSDNLPPAPIFILTAHTRNGLANLERNDSSREMQILLGKMLCVSLKWTRR